MKITALLVSHNGARWLPAVLAGLAASTRKLDAIVAVDTGSGDESADLVERAIGAPVVRLDPRTPYAEAIRVALENAAPAVPDEWVWLVHDDSNPAPECLETLVAAAGAASRDVAVLGPKLREWPSLKRLLEVGVTLTGTGQRETGLERGEYDQGQHDEPHQVLAVNTAGMLVRRDVLEKVRLDQYLPVFGTDIDFGWRVARAGFATRVVPDAVMFHLEASRQGRRSSELVEHPGRQAREGAQYTLLVNSPAWTIPFRSVRMVIGGLLRALGLLLVRAPGEAADEVAALLNVFSHPRRILRARKGRAEGAALSHREIRPLLAPFWLPYRHGLDYVTDVGLAVAESLREQAARRRPPGVTEETPWFVRVLRSPALWALLLAVVAGRSFLGGEGSLQGGALLPVPDGVGHWWGTWAAGQHDLSTGSSMPGPAYLLPMAAAGTVLLGNVGLLLDLIFVLAVPMAFLAALRFLRRLCAGPVAPIWGAATYAVLPVVSGAVGQGRLGAVVGAVLVPLVATAALGLGATTSSESGHPPEIRRWRSAWRTALLAGLLVAFAPPAMIVIALLVLFGAVGGNLAAGRRELAVLLLVPVLVVLPWAVATLQVPGAWLVEAGRAAALPADPGFWDLVLGRSGAAEEAPAWFAVGLPLAALLAMIRPDTRGRVLQAWALVLAAAVVLAVTARVPVVLPGVPYDFRPWPGLLLVLVQGGFVAAAAIAGDGALRRLSEASFSWRQPAVAVTAALALVAPVLGAGWWLVRVDDGLVQKTESAALPTYIKELARGTDLVGVLRVTGGRNGIEYQVLRSGPERLGDDGVVALTEPDRRFRALVERLLSSAGPDDAATLASYGIKYVYAPPPVAGVVSGGFDAAPGFAPGSEPRPGTRTWIVEPASSLENVEDDRSLLRPLWLLISVLTLITAVVLAAPDRRRR